jgi:para-aminobenzoate synthetase component 1
MGYSILAAEPATVVRSRGRRIEVVSAEGLRVIEGNPFDVLSEQLVNRHNTVKSDFPVGAAIGYLGYELKNFVEELPSRAPDDIGLPDCWFGFYDNLLAFDHAKKEICQVGSTQVGREDPANSHPRGLASRVTSNFTRNSYRDAVLRAKRYIAAGDIYQVNLSQRFQCGVDASATEVYLALRQANPAP